jgi:hypothetical protein
MKAHVRLVVHGLLFVLGLVMMVWGIVAAKYVGAGIGLIGLIVAAVNVQQFLKKNKATTDERIGHTL